MKIILHILIFIFLTVLTQIGGIIYVATLLIMKKAFGQKRYKIFGLFTVLYVIATFLIVPNLAPVFGREKIKETEFIKAHSIFYILANRNYVRPELNSAINKISNEFQMKNKGIKIIYLDANFPFIDKFPLLPHLSHNDGKKIDVSFVYELPGGIVTNEKPSISGYGVYEGPKKGEYDQISVCKNSGNWHYDFPKYMTFGTINKQIEFSEKGTKNLANTIVQQNEIAKLFIEPHLKNRLKLSSEKVRFHGCRAVRHDDHIHFQIK